MKLVLVLPLPSSAWSGGHTMCLVSSACLVWWFSSSSSFMGLGRWRTSQAWGCCQLVCVVAALEKLALAVVLLTGQLRLCGCCTRAGHVLLLVVLYLWCLYLNLPLMIALSRNRAAPACDRKVRSCVTLAAWSSCLLRVLKMLLRLLFVPVSRWAAKSPPAKLSLSRLGRRCTSWFSR
jgi:hypothetical protein